MRIDQSKTIRNIERLEAEIRDLERIYRQNVSGRVTLKKEIEKKKALISKNQSKLDERLNELSEYYRLKKLRDQQALAAQEKWFESVIRRI